MAEIMLAASREVVRMQTILYCVSGKQNLFFKIVLRKRAKRWHLSVVSGAIGTLGDIRQTMDGEGVDQPTGIRAFDQLVLDKQATGWSETRPEMFEDGSQ